MRRHFQQLSERAQQRLASDNKDNNNHADDETCDSDKTPTVSPIPTKATLEDLCRDWRQEESDNYSELSVNNNGDVRDKKEESGYEDDSSEREDEKSDTTSWFDPSPELCDNNDDCQDNETSETTEVGGDLNVDSEKLLTSDDGDSTATETNDNHGDGDADTTAGSKHADDTVGDVSAGGYEDKTLSYRIGHISCIAHNERVFTPIHDTDASSTYIEPKDVIPIYVKSNYGSSDGKISIAVNTPTKVKANVDASGASAGEGVLDLSLSPSGAFKRVPSSNCSESETPTAQQISTKEKNTEYKPLFSNISQMPIAPTFFTPTHETALGKLIIKVESNAKTEVKYASKRDLSLEKHNSIPKTVELKSTSMANGHDSYKTSPSVLPNKEQKPKTVEAPKRDRSPIRDSSSHQNVDEDYRQQTHRKCAELYGKMQGNYFGNGKRINSFTKHGYRNTYNATETRQQPVNVVGPYRQQISHLRDNKLDCQDVQTSTYSGTNALQSTQTEAEKQTPNNNNSVHETKNSKANMKVPQLHNQGVTQQQPHTDIRYCSTSDIYNSHSGNNLKMYKTMDDMINLWGPLTEDSVVKTLQARYYDKRYKTWIGPILVCLNNRSIDLDHCQVQPANRKCRYLRRVVQKIFSYRPETVRETAGETHAHTIILSGSQASGKTHASIQLLQHLFDLSGSGSRSLGSGTQTDSYKHLQATYCVLRSLTCAANKYNQHASQMGILSQSYINDAAIHRTKIHGQFLDQGRIIQPPADEQNYNIFYEMLSGLSKQEKVRYNLSGFGIHNLWYLGGGDLCTQQNALQDRERFNKWKSSLAILGIPVGDVLRVLSAILLLGNVQFMDGGGLELEIQGQTELQSVASLLGVSSKTLITGFTTLTRKAKGQTYRSYCSPQAANAVRNTLAKALYLRTVLAIIKRANSSKPRPSVANSTVSSDGSTDSTDLQHRSGNSSSSSSRQCTEQIVGILDLPGFTSQQLNNLEQLHRNLCVERLHHHYVTTVFVDPLRYCHDNGIQYDSDVMYLDNCDVIKLIDDPQTGLLGLLNTECLQPTRSSFLQKARVHHKMNQLFDDLPANASKDGESFVVRHFCGDVTYSSHDLVATNQDSLPDDVVAVFAKNTCNFGFVTHLFAAEIKAISVRTGVCAPAGDRYRVTKGLVTTGSDRRGDTLSGTVTSQIDSILENIRTTQTHFVHCIQATSDMNGGGVFDRELVIPQIRALQLLESLHVMTDGFPHKMRYRVFTHHYRLFAKAKIIFGTSNVRDQTKIILDAFMSHHASKTLPPMTTHWAFGKNYIFFSEYARQSFESLRDYRLHYYCSRIQALWRGNVCRRRWRSVKLQYEKQNGGKAAAATTRGRSNVRVVPKERQPRASSWTPMVPVHRNALQPQSKQDQQAATQAAALKQTCSIYGLDMDQPPPVPSRRGYSVQGGVKVSFPQLRQMTNDFQVFGASSVRTTLKRGEEVKVVSMSTKPGHVLVEHGRHLINVPGSYTRLKAGMPSPRHRTMSSPGTVL